MTHSERIEALEAKVKALEDICENVLDAVTRQEEGIKFAAKVLANLDAKVRIVYNQANEAKGAIIRPNGRTN